VSVASARSHAKTRTLRPAVCLAACGVALLAYQLWTVAGWLADGPHQITADRSHGDLAWYAARAVELVVVASVAGFVVKAVRDYRREGRLGVDALLIIGMFSAGFWDPIYNWLTPAWMYSSNFLNVNDWLAHAPGVVNPDMGHQPWPVVIVLIGYPLWGVGFAMVVNVVMRAARARGIAPVPAGLVTAIAITVTSFSVFKALDLMSAPGFRFEFLRNSDVLVAGLSGGVVFWALACVRFFTVDGRAFFERGSSNSFTSILAAMATCQMIVIVGWGLLTVPFTPHSSPYPRLPAHLVNRLCDAPGIQGTSYGACPGAPGFDLPRR
jgi:hypothetical protein